MIWPSQLQIDESLLVGWTRVRSLAGAVWTSVSGDEVDLKNHGGQAVGGQRGEGKQGSVTEPGKTQPVEHFTFDTVGFSPLRMIRRGRGRGVRWRFGIEE
jgi:hypothetical protein